MLCERWFALAFAPRCRVWLPRNECGRAAGITRLRHVTTQNTPSSPVARCARYLDAHVTRRCRTTVLLMPAGRDRIGRWRPRARAIPRCRGQSPDSGHLVSSGQLVGCPHDVPTALFDTPKRVGPVSSASAARVTSLSSIRHGRSAKGLVFRLTLTDPRESTVAAPVISTANFPASGAVRRSGSGQPRRPPPA